MDKIELSALANEQYVFFGRERPTVDEMIDKMASNLAFIKTINKADDSEIMDAAGPGIAMGLKNIIAAALKLNDLLQPPAGRQAKLPGADGGEEIIKPRPLFVEPEKVRKMAKRVQEQEAKVLDPPESEAAVIAEAAIAIKQVKKFNDTISAGLGVIKAPAADRVHASIKDDGFIRDPSTGFLENEPCSCLEAVIPGFEASDAPPGFRRVQVRAGNFAGLPEGSYDADSKCTFCKGSGMRPRRLDNYGEQMGNTDSITENEPPGSGAANSPGASGEVPATPGFTAESVPHLCGVCKQPMKENKKSWRCAACNITERKSTGKVEKKKVLGSSEA